MEPNNLTEIFKYSALIGTVVFGLKTFLPLDFGSEVSADFNSVADTDASFNFFTIESIAAFFMCGGWIGWLALINAGFGHKKSVLLALGAGIIGMLFFTWLISMFKKLEYVPKADIKELLNKKGKAYLRFSPKGSGKITIEFNSKEVVIDAVNDTEDEIEAFDPIEVIKVQQDIIYIKKI